MLDFSFFFSDFGIPIIIILSALTALTLYKFLYEVGKGIRIWYAEWKRYRI